jgi:ubiquinone/menaquinone biosynthesis C-methylase UbiE
MVAAYYDRMNVSVEHRWAGARRAAPVANPTGEVLDVGAGTGVNLRHFRAAEEFKAAPRIPPIAPFVAGTAVPATS